MIFLNVNFLEGGQNIWGVIIQRFVLSHNNSQNGFSKFNFLNFITVVLLSTNKVDFFNLIYSEIKVRVRAFSGKRIHVLFQISLQ